MIREREKKRGKKKRRRKKQKEREKKRNKCHFYSGFFPAKKPKTSHTFALLKSKHGC